MRTGQRIDVPVVVGESHVASYVDEGYLVVPGLVDEEEQERIRADMVAFARGAYPIRDHEPVGEEASDEDALRTILAIHFPHWVSDVMLEFVKHPLVCGVLSQIAGAHLPGWDGSVKCMQSMAFVKPPGLPGQAWHQDERHIPTRDRSLVGAWIALDDATVDNGCLWVVPGSHRSGYLYPTRDHGSPEEYDHSDESYGFDEAAAVPVECEAGSVVFFNGYLLHESLRNRSDRYRRVLVNHYCNAWSLLPWVVKDGEHPATADRRAVVPVAGVDPYAWKGYDEPPRQVFLRPYEPTTSVG